MIESTRSVLLNEGETALLHHTNSDFEVVIVEDETDYELRWGDHVANVWSEVYPKLSLAVARLAVLLSCGEVGWNAGFALESAAFADEALDFHVRMMTE